MNVDGAGIGTARGPSPQKAALNTSTGSKAKSGDSGSFDRELERGSEDTATPSASRATSGDEPRQNSDERADEKKDERGDSADGRKTAESGTAESERQHKAADGEDDRNEKSQTADQGDERNGSQNKANPEDGKKDERQGRGRSAKENGTEATDNRGERLVSRAESADDSVKASTPKTQPGEQADSSAKETSSTDAKAASSSEKTRASAENGSTGGQASKEGGGRTASNQAGDQKASADAPGRRSEGVTETRGQTTDRSKGASTEKGINGSSKEAKGHTTEGSASTEARSQETAQSGTEAAQSTTEKTTTEGARATTEKASASASSTKSDSTSVTEAARNRMATLHAGRSQADVRVSRDPRTRQAGKSGGQEKTVSSAEGETSNRSSNSGAKIDAKAPGPELLRDRIVVRQRQAGGFSRYANFATSPARTEDGGVTPSTNTAAALDANGQRGAMAQPRSFSGTSSGRSQQPAHRQVSVRMLQGLKAGQGRVTVDLHPPRLGRVEVRMNVQGNKLRVRVSADTSEALDQLQRESKSLEKSLAEAGFDTGNGLQFEMRDQGGNNDARFDEEADIGQAGAASALSGDDSDDRPAPSRSRDLYDVVV